MEIKKFDPVIRQHVIYKEGKIWQLLVSSKPGLVPGFFMAGIQHCRFEGRLAVQTEPQRLEQRDHRGRVDRHHPVAPAGAGPAGEQCQTRASAVAGECCGAMAGPSWQIERIGQGWRSAPDLGLGSAQLAARIEAWQGWLLPPGEPVRGTGDPQDLDRRTERSGGSRALSGRRQVCRPAASSTWLSLSQAQYRDLMRPIPEREIAHA
jgi:hypothetical protein